MKYDSHEWLRINSLHLSIKPHTKLYSSRSGNVTNQSIKKFLHTSIIFYVALKATESPFYLTEFR